MFRNFLALTFTCLFAVTATAAETRARYDAESRTLNVTTDAERQFKYVFNKGGAICEIYDLDIAPDANLVGESYQGETTDRVIQWTYWNDRYRAAPHTEGSKDSRANVTMEGCYHETHACDALQTPKSGPTRTLVFRSCVTHWFFANLDRHGRPDFETTSRYEVLDDGSLRLTRSVLRRAWTLRDVTVRKWDGKRWQESHADETKMEATLFPRRPTTSYFEGWTPMRRTVLPRAIHGRGKFNGAGYKYWKPADLGGWAMAHSDEQAFAVVFGVGNGGDGKTSPRSVFNRLDLPQHRLNILLPAVTTDWPENTTLTQTLVFVVGAPKDVAERANKLVESVPPPSLSVN